MSLRKNVYILGAGASAEAGAPLMWDFLSTAKELALEPNRRLSPEDKQRFLNVFDYRFAMERSKAAVDVDLDNIEDLFGLVDLECRIGKEAAANVRHDLVFMVTKTLELRTGMTEGALRIRPVNDPRHLKGTFALYASFVALVAGMTGRVDQGRLFWQPRRDRTESDTVITFNYDMVMESAMAHVGVAPDYKIPQMPVHSPAGQQLRNMELLKLHGSVNWLACPLCKDGTVRLEWNRHDSPCPKRGGQAGHKMEPVIVPPTWDKALGTGLNSVWQAAREALASAARWVIIGYSMPATDRFFHYLMASAIEANRDLESVIVIDNATGRKKTALRRRYKELFSRSFATRRLRFASSPFPELSNEALPLLKRPPEPRADRSPRRGEVDYE